MLDRDGRLRRWNARFERVSAYDPGELAGRSAEDFFEGADRTRVAEAMSRVFQNGSATVGIAENLPENAIKFTPEGGTIDLRVRQDHGTAVLEVEDTGVGIGEEALPHVFDAFKQESEGLTRESEGSGLGLADVKELTELMGGTIEVDSEKGEGIRFTVSLPLDTSSA